jgi:tetratricopeptide (TPR) repeat protein
VVFKLAKKYHERANSTKALELYKEVLAIDADGKMGTTDFYEGKKVTYTEYAEFSIGEMSLFDRKMDPEPLKAFIKKYTQSEILKSAYSVLSIYYRSSGSKEDATKFFEEYISKYPDDLSVLNSYVSRIIRDKENLERGIELAEKIKEVMKYNPDPSYMRNLAELYALKGDKGKAEDVFGKNFMEGKVSRLAYNLYERIGICFSAEMAD